LYSLDSKKQTNNLQFFVSQLSNHPERKLNAPKNIAHVKKKKKKKKKKKRLSSKEKPQ